jgi:hypothetical protein
MPDANKSTGSQRLGVLTHMVRDLARLEVEAASVDLQFLGYLLSMARIEADEQLSRATAGQSSPER